VTFLFSSLFRFELEFLTGDFLIILSSEMLTPPDYDYPIY